MSIFVSLAPGDQASVEAPVVGSDRQPILTPQRAWSIPSGLIAGVGDVVAASAALAGLSLWGTFAARDAVLVALLWLVLLAGAGGFEREVPEPKSVKNRIHLDLRPRSRTRDEEVAWLLEYGATQVADLRGKYGPGTGWVVLADPEGNEFCILRSDAELATES